MKGREGAGRREEEEDWGGARLNQASLLPSNTALHREWFCPTF